MSTRFDELRSREFAQRLGPSQVYADWTGAALAPDSLIDHAADFLRGNLLGNPHSHHAPSAFAMEQVVAARSEVLRFLNADPNEYEVIFTPGASGAIRIMQHFLFDGGELLMTADNHNTVNGLREDVRRYGGISRYAPLTPDLTFDEDRLDHMLRYPRSTGNKLFAFPSKSNYTGTIHPLKWVRRAQDLGWAVLMDSAAYLSNSHLDLSTVKPDFVLMSFYKLFGYPTGLGCLVIKKSSYRFLHKRWFAGGSILLVSVMKPFFAPESLGYARFEDGTINFAGIPLISAGFKFLEDLGDIRPHSVGLGSRLHEILGDMRVGQNSVVLHTPHGNDVVTFSIRKGDKIIDAWEFEHFANARGVFVRTGCFCNPGVNEEIFQYGIETFERMYNDAISPDAMTVESLKEFSGGKPIGAIRASFGYANVMSDIERFAAVTREFLETA